MKALSKFHKTLLLLALGIGKTAVGTIPIANENTKKVVGKLEDVAEKSVEILTDSNPDDEAQFKALYEEQKYAVLDLGLDIAEDEFAHVQNETTKVVALAAIKIIRDIMANPSYAVTEADVMDLLQAANLEVQDAKE